MAKWRVRGFSFLCFSSIVITLSFPLSALAQVTTETEPNDKREQAQEIRLGDTVEGGFHQDSDDDWYKFTVDQAGKNYLRIDLSAVPEVDTRLYLLDANGRTLLDMNDARKNEVETIAFFPVEPGTYFVRVYAGGKATAEKYSLSLKLDGPWQEGQEFEPNDRREQANDLPLGRSVEGYFQYRGDYDYFRLLVDQPGRHEISIDLSALPNYDQQFEIQDKDGKELWSAKGRPRGEPESVAYFTVKEGVYYIWVGGNQKQIADKYTLSTRLLGPWRENEEAEPNDEIKWANEVNLGAPLTGRVNRDVDADYYVFTVPEPGFDLLIIQMSGIPGASSHLELVDSKENRLDMSMRGEVGEGEEIVRMKFKPGTHYLEIHPPPRNKTGSEYTLYVGKPQKPPAADKEVQQALVKALDWLASRQQKDGSWSQYETAYTGLSLMAFIGAKCVQKDYSVNINGAINYLKSKYKPISKFPEGSKDGAYYGGQLGSDNMYEHAIATLGLIEALVDLNDPSLEPIAQDAINLIIRSQNTEHKPETLGGPFKPDSKYYGGWRYNPGSTNSDLSVSGWQILTLKAAVNAGFSVPDYVFPAAAGFVRSLQGKKDGSFLYDSPGESGNSCARAGMGALSLQLCGFPQDPAIPPALRFMQDNAPRWNIEQPGNGYPFYYWYYGTRAMFLSGGDDWRIWKDWMCRFLVDHQNGDGSWDGKKSEQSLDTYRVALGALMLEFCCGHVPIYMSPVKRLGSGTIKVDFEKGAEKEASKNVEIIMDASNSMWGQIGGEAKITIARKVLAQIINGLPDSMNVGLRVYGHRYGLNDKLACTDTQILVPIGPVAKAQLIDTVNEIQLKGKTPLVLSVLEAIKDFEKIPNGSVILVTDGIESCNGDIKSIGPAVKKSGLELKVHIVGFDIKEKEARAELEAIAKSTEGRYLDAKNAGELLSALEQTLKLEYIVLDEKGEEAGRGTVGGDEVKLKEGTYTLRVLLAPQPLETKVEVKAGGRSVCILKKEAGAWKLGC
jgi:hypothetical protein